jgi:hypothetical protein
MNEPEGKTNTICRYLVSSQPPKSLVQNSKKKCEKHFFLSGNSQTWEEGDSRHLIFFITYEFGLLAQVLIDIVKCNTLAHWARSKIMKKMKCCEYGPWAVFPKIVFSLLLSVCPWLAFLTYYNISQ